MKQHTNRKVQIKCELFVFQKLMTPKKEDNFMIRTSVLLMSSLAPIERTKMQIYCIMHLKNQTLKSPSKTILPKIRGIGIFSSKIKKGLQILDQFKKRRRKRVPFLFDFQVYKQNLTEYKFKFKLMSKSQRPSFIQKCKQTFLKMDLFANPQLLKYRGEGAYQTYTGSIVSVLIVTIFFVAFYSMIKSTINREKITTIPKFKPSLDSTYTTNSQDKSFMFGIGLQGFDLTANQKFFNISMYTKIYRNSKLVSSQEIGLQPCTVDQWSNINSQFQKVFTRLNMKNWLCPPKGHNFTFKGKYTSEQFIYTKISVKKCSNSNACVSNSTFNDSLTNNKTFKLSAYFANPVIDPSEKNYLDYVLEDTSYFQFTDKVGVNSHMFFTEYEINTDNTILPEPFTDIQTSRGLTLIERPVVSNIEIIESDQYVRIHLKKADLIQQYDRSYTRLDVTFAYLGGLFGMVMIIFYGMKVLSEYAYEYQIGNDLFKYKEDKQFQSSKFHIFRFPLYLLYCIITFFYPKSEDWSCFQFYKQVDECREEVKKQSDVCFLLKRVIYIQKALQIFYQGRLNQIKLDHKWTIQQARTKRQFYDNHKKILQMIKASESNGKNKEKGERTIYGAQFNINDQISYNDPLDFQKKEAVCPSSSSRQDPEKPVQEFEIKIKIAQNQSIAPILKDSKRSNNKLERLSSKSNSDEKNNQKQNSSFMELVALSPENKQQKENQNKNSNRSKTKK